METDFLVIGSGIAGLTFAVKVAKEFPDKKVVIVTKASQMKPTPNMPRAESLV